MVEETVPVVLLNLVQHLNHLNHNQQEQQILELLVVLDLVVVQMEMVVEAVEVPV